MSMSRIRDTDAMFYSGLGLYRNYKNEMKETFHRPDSQGKKKID